MRKQQFIRMLAVVAITAFMLSPNAISSAYAEWEFVDDLSEAGDIGFFNTDNCNYRISIDDGLTQHHIYIDKIETYAQTLQLLRAHITFRDVDHLVDAGVLPEENFNTLKAALNSDNVHLSFELIVRTNLILQPPTREVMLRQGYKSIAVDMIGSIWHSLIEDNLALEAQCFVDEPRPLIPNFHSEPPR